METNAGRVFPCGIIWDAACLFHVSPALHTIFQTKPWIYHAIEFKVFDANWFGVMDMM